MQFSEYDEKTDLFQLTSENENDEGPVENTGTIDVFLGPLSKGSNSKKACEASYVEVFGLPDDREEYDENIDHYVYPTTFQGKDAYWYEARTEIFNSPLRTITCEIIPGQLLMLQLTHETDAGIQELIKYTEKNLVVKDAQ